MTNTKITAESFLDSKELREQAMNRIEVLNKVKQLFLIPELECMTVKQVADYFEVDSDTIKKQYQRNQDEFDSDGTCIKTLSDFRSLSGTSCPSLKTAQRRGFLEITLADNTTLSIPNCGIKCYPKRAILRMGMLLRDSRVAREIRDQLLNTFEHVTEAQKVASINEEETLVGNIVKAALNGDMTTTVTSLSEYIGYKNRYIAEIEKHNVELTETNEKVISENKELTFENNVLATDILKWTDRSSANRIVRVLAGCLHKRFSDTFNLVYHELLYKYSISLKGRAALRRKKNLPLISFVRDDEWIYIYKVVAAICNKNHINLSSLFKKAKIDVSDLDLSE